ncbi:heterokaryon incompatibility protein-domain-containing protein, partial [Colletotrichum cereale]
MDRDTLAQSPCPICRLIAQVVPGILNGKHCQLIALPSSRAILGRKPNATKQSERSDCTVLFPVLKDKAEDKTLGKDVLKDWYEAGCLALLKAGDPETGPRQTSPFINFRLVRGWLEQCRAQHRKTCRTGGGSDFVRGLRVIDCQSWSTIEAPPSCLYIALSYVWGDPVIPHPQENDASSEKKDVVEFPPVVLDAMNVTRSLGEKYLWVDKYCIDQKDGPTKRAQIAQMHEIYSRAHLTLVAAAGEDSSYGLPGIRKKHRPRMGRFSVGDVNIVQMLPHTSAQTLRSKWATRGWTYQEGYLAPRRLIFTDNQVSYLCNAMHCAETIRKPQNL